MNDNERKQAAECLRGVATMLECIQAGQESPDPLALMLKDDPVILRNVAEALLTNHPTDQDEDRVEVVAEWLWKRDYSGEWSPSERPIQAEVAREAARELLALLDPAPTDKRWTIYRGHDGLRTVSAVHGPDTDWIEVVPGPTDQDEDRVKPCRSIRWRNDAPCQLPADHEGECIRDPAPTDQGAEATGLEPWPKERLQLVEYGEVDYECDAEGHETLTTRRYVPDQGAEGLVRVGERDLRTLLSDSASGKEQFDAKQRIRAALADEGEKP